MIALLFKVLLFLIPLVFLKNTSELFEFNKIIVLYIFTILIISSWIIKSVKEKKVIFSRTILDIPLATYLAVLFFSAIFSINPTTSWLGYYSRFNGGLVSQISYCLLYWAFVSNIEKKQVKNIIKYSIYGLLISSIFAILEHFQVGITCGLMGLGWSTDCWVQDVANRVFSTFGQPNWLAAYLVIILPLCWQIMIDQNNTNTKKIIWGIVSAIFFTTLLFTKSRSGLLGFGVASLVFWGFLIRKHKLKFTKEIVILNLVFVALFFVFQSPITNHQSPITVSSGPALETGGTESGEIRKNVWSGAIEIWKHFPILGSGVETFAFAFPMHKPFAHNLVSEWDFIYNKAHNEYLNYLATTGTLGFLSYMAVIITSIVLIAKTKRYEYLAGYLSILVTNFFGFSVVPVSLIFFLFPALAVVDDYKKVDKKTKEQKGMSTQQYLYIAGVCLVTSYFLLATIKYWYSDVLYNKGKLFNRSGNFIKASETLKRAIKLNYKEPLFLSEFSKTNSEIAIILAKEDDTQKALEFAELSIDMSKKAVLIAPYNINIKKVHAGVLSKLSQFDPNYLTASISVIESAIQIAPTDPKLHYQLGLLYLKTGQNQKGLNTLEKAVELKPNYKEGRFALALTYKDFEEFSKSKEQFQYILKYIDPKDELTKKYFNELN